MLHTWWALAVANLIEPRVGGRWAMGGLDDNPDPATITAFEPGRAVTIDMGGMVAAWTLTGSAGRTRLTLVQSVGETVPTGPGPATMIE
ncbi:hypothetical protein [Pseudonocardia sp. N23]|uniref:hypothetical protein n=1 Tax=Pseudonocardia sp. N23 TaxID=1987376 RepID=UPI000BFEA347|nr:hypothetical protein [Pseudonocardia sp. N23]GAY07444.1 hypothetical protein TOK_3464 [Pseudonocardia sp. N23]